MIFADVVRALESKGIMPKTKPGLEKIRAAVIQKPWFSTLDRKKIITVAGTNGKGTTSACLETLLMAAGQRVGLYTSPHLIQTTERIRVQQKDISEETFCQLYESNLEIIESFQLSHFESLTLMAADYFFSKEYLLDLDFVILEVGLGGTFDATNIFPNHWSIITALGLDHVDILGSTLAEVAANKFGIVKIGGVVVYQRLASELIELKMKVQRQTDSHWIETKSFGQYKINLLGERAVINSQTALTMFEQMGFSPSRYLHALENVRWAGRMQKVHLKKHGLDVFLSGDHNPQGIESMLQIIRTMPDKKFHFILGIGKDKAADEMLTRIYDVPSAKVYLTETPFKGTALPDYSEKFRKKAEFSSADIEKIFSYLKSQILTSNDCVIVSGSLYLVGQVLKDHQLAT